MLWSLFRFFIMLIENLPRCFSKGAFYIKHTCKDLKYPESTVKITSGQPLDKTVQVGLYFFHFVTNTRQVAIYRKKQK